MYTDGNGVVAQINVDTMKMSLSNVTFTSIYSGYSGFVPSYGGVFNI